MVDRPRHASIAMSERGADTVGWDRWQAEIPSIANNYPLLADVRTTE
jgi:hypothetical protein